jgi:tRNA (cmo5U34)-methyltransferase|tara:strand:- start:543 stop:1220 length:678 start_codon:yes stop_codon:yes gene_type:complete
MAKFTFATSKEGFDNHIDKSIRGYSDLWSDILSLSQYFVEDYTQVVDLGCSSGKLLKGMIEQNKKHIPHAQYTGIEIEADFFGDYNDDESKYEMLNYFRGDVRDFDFENCSLVTSIFTLQFMAPKNRQEIIQKVYDGLNTGGAFVFSEKTLSCNPRVQDMMTFCYYDYKRKNFSDKEILDKEVQLRHMMKLNTKTELFTMCEDVGFEVHTFWQNYNFLGFICLKK